MRIRFIATDKTKEFHKDEELEGFYSPSPTRKPLICITKKRGRTYAYPAEWFEVIDESEKEVINYEQGYTY